LKPIIFISAFIGFNAIASTFSLVAGKRC